eukprot:11788267-Alexandrium_andersonii.AAC.1
MTFPVVIFAIASSGNPRGLAPDPSHPRQGRSPPTAQPAWRHEEPNNKPVPKRPTYPFHKLVRKNAKFVEN